MTVAAKTCPTCGRDYPADVAVCPRDGAALVGTTDGTFVRDPLIGQVVGEYQVVRRIGAGGMGIVYEAVHPIIGKRAAVKVLRPETAEDPDQMARLLAEAKAIAAIHHQAVIDIFGFGQLPDGRHYMVMAYLDGEGLDVVLERQRKLPLADALNVLEQIASGLGAAHAVGVVHRDLKPSNVILVEHADGTREVKVLDFGLAKAGRPNQSIPQTNVGRALGTPEYMAPEQARGSAVGPRSDLYALGILGFELVLGYVPFTGPSPMEVMLKQVNEPPPKPSALDPSLPAAFDELITRLLAKDPDDRPASTDEVRLLINHVRHPVLTSRPRPSRPRSAADGGRSSSPSHQAQPLRPTEPTMPEGRSLAPQVAQDLAPRAPDATVPDLRPVEGTTGKARALATDVVLSDVPTTQHPTLRREGQAKATDLARTAEVERSADVASASTSEVAELVPPRRSAAPLVVLGALGLVVIAGLAWLAWPAAEEPAPSVELRRPLSVDPAHAKAERAPGAPADPPALPTAPPTNAVAPSPDPAPAPALPETVVDTEPNEPEPAPAADDPRPGPKKPPTAAPADPTSQKALLARVRDLEKRLGPRREGLAAAFLDEFRQRLKERPSAEERRQLGRDLDEWESRYLKSR